MIFGAASWSLNPLKHTLAGALMWTQVCIFHPAATVQPSAVKREILKTTDKPNGPLDQHHRCISEFAARALLEEAQGLEPGLVEQADQKCCERWGLAVPGPAGWWLQPPQPREPWRVQSRQRLAWILDLWTSLSKSGGCVVGGSAQSSRHVERWVTSSAGTTGCSGPLDCSGPLAAIIQVVS